MVGLLMAATTTTVANVHRGAVLPAARVIVVTIPALALAFYLFVMRRRRDEP